MINIQNIDDNECFKWSIFKYFNHADHHPARITKADKCYEEKHVDLLLIGAEGKRNYVLIKNFDTFMYDHTLQRPRKNFSCYCLQVFSTEEILKSHIKDCFKINSKQRIIMPKKAEFVKFKNY